MCASRGSPVLWGRAQTKGTVDAHGYPQPALHRLRRGTGVSVGERRVSAPSHAQRCVLGVEERWRVWLGRSGGRTNNSLFVVGRRIIIRTSGLLGIIVPRRSSSGLSLKQQTNERLARGCVECSLVQCQLSAVSVECSIS
jgi:hypothetical protein